MTYYSDSTVLLDRDDRVFELRQGDTAPSMRVRLEGVESNSISDTPVPADLSLTSAIVFVLSMDGEVYVRRSVSYLDQEEHPGEIEVLWAQGDTQYVGTYTGEFEVTWNDGSLQTFPSSHALTIVVTQDAG